MDLKNNKPEILYPTEWQYKIIVTDVTKMVEAVESVVNELQYDLTPSNISKKAKYFSLNLLVTVPSESVRDKIFQELTNHPAIKFVI